MMSQHGEVPKDKGGTSVGVSPSLGGGSREPPDKASPKESVVEPTKEKSSHVPQDVQKPMKLPPLPSFAGEDREDVDALDRWLARVEKHSELMHWSERTKLLQFELHLSGRAECMYELLSPVVKSTFEKASQALRERLYPVENEALVSAKLMRRKQLSHESVDEFAQDLEKLFERSYGRRRGMDESSKALLKRDVFVQGLLLKWQKKVLPSASTFSDALHQARAAEQQERQLSKMHPPQRIGSKSRPSSEDNPQSTPPAKLVKGDKPPSRPRREPAKCFECSSTAHKWRDCPLLKPTETPGKVKTASTKAITTSSGATESLDEKCQRLQQEWTDAEFTRLYKGYDASVVVDQVVGAVGPLCYATVEIAGQTVDAMVDTGSSATILSFELFKRIGKNAKIPTSALSKPDVILRDYNKRPVLVGAKVDLTFRVKERSVTAPVYIKSSGSNEAETCLLGTNVIFALGLMQPAEEVCKKNDGHPTSGTVSLVRGKRIPARMGSYLDGHVEGQFKEDTLLLFEPSQCLSDEVGLEFEDCIIKVSSEGHIQVPILNRSNEALNFPGGVSIGSVKVLHACEMSVTTPIEESSTETGPSVAMVRTTSSSSRRQEWLASTLKMSQALTSEESKLLQDCVLQHHEVFAIEDNERGEVVDIEHRIDTSDSPPIRQIPRRVPFAVRGEMSRMVREMLRDDVIKELASPWASPVVLVREKDGSLRFCVDYRQLNAVTHKDTFPLPRIDDLLDQMQGKKVFSTIDAKRGYWQIKVHEASREKTAFVTFDGLYEFKVMPFGLCNAPSTFQRLMQKILCGFSSFCSVYIDDILVFSESIEEHITHLSRVF